MKKVKLKKLLEATAEILGNEQVNEDTSLMELGIDSMNIVQLIMACEQIYGGNIDPDSLELDEYTTLSELDEKLNPASTS